MSPELAARQPEAVLDEIEQVLEVTRAEVRR
jgi:hypothetical protein